jgi:hypothetical protein
MNSQTHDFLFSNVKTATKTIVLSYILGFFVFLGSFSPPFFKAINNSLLIRQAMLSSNLSNPTSGYLQFVQVVHWSRIALVVLPIIISFLVLWILFIQGNFLLPGVKSIGLALLISGSITFVCESILYIVINSFQGIQNYRLFLGLSGNSADVAKMLALQSGDVFLFYWGMTSFGILTLGLVLILVARVLEQ